MKTLQRTEFGDPVLREVASRRTPKQSVSPKTKALIRDMRHTLTSKKMGVGLAAPQVGEGVALAVIAIHPTAHRSEVDPLDLAIINPRITKFIGRRPQMWEGCISAGTGGLFAKVPRYKTIRLSYFDEQGKRHNREFAGLPAQVIQHEVDHLNGILFVDRVKDTKTYMTMKEYKKMALAKHKN